MRARLTMRAIHSIVGTLFVAALIVGTTPRAKAEGEARIWTGVFSAEQVARGKEAFEANCARCHQATLTGSDRGPALKGTNFWAHWENETINTLFIKVRDNMPPNLTGNQLEPQTKLDIVSYVLNSNELPTGTSELKVADRDVLDDLQIVKKGAVATVPNFALIQAVGCLAQDSDQRWLLTRSSVPARTTQPVAGAGAEKASASQALGAETFLLTSIRGFKPDTYKGHKVEARGLVYRAPADNRIDLTSLETVASTCGE